MRKDVFYDGVWECWQGRSTCPSTFVWWRLGHCKVEKRLRDGVRESGWRQILLTRSAMRNPVCVCLCVCAVFKAQADME